MTSSCIESFSCIGSNERADCTVRALSTCMNVSYEDAHEIMKSKGRKDGRTTQFRLPIIEDLGFEDRADLSCMTLQRALPSMAIGRFIVRVRRHVFAVIDGVVYDHTAPKKGTRILMVYERK